MTVCAVASCKNSQRTQRDRKDLVFHKFPKSTVIAQEWLAICQREDKVNIKNAAICSDHFTDVDYIRDLQHELLNLPARKRKSLKDEAVPSINLPPKGVQRMQRNVKNMGLHYSSINDICQIPKSMGKVEEFDSAEEEKKEILCRNCCKLMETNSGTTNLKMESFSDQDLDEIQIIDAIAYIYGASWEEFRNWENSSSKMKNSESVLADSAVKLCDPCALIFSDMYKAYRKFELLSDPSSLFHQIKGFRISGWQPICKIEADCSSDVHNDDNVDKNNDDDDPFNSNLLHEEHENLPIAVKCEFNDQDALSNAKSCTPYADLEPDTKNEKISLERGHSFVKLKRLSNEDLNGWKKANVKETPKWRNRGKRRRATEERSINKEFECKVCGKMCKNVSEYKLEHLSGDCGLRLNCRICGKVSANNRSLLQHLRNHDSKNTKPSKKYHCTLCEKPYRSKSILREHMKLRHDPAAKKYKCNKCDRICLRKETYDRHMVIHSGQANYLCGDCGKTFAFRSQLSVHQILHGEKKFSCDICSKKFSTGNILAKHKESHSTERKHVCEHCGKTFKFKAHLALHLKLHREIAEKREFKCDECGKVFQHSKSLYVHKTRKHSSKIHQCSICGKRLSRAEKVKDHERTVHKISPNVDNQKPAQNNPTKQKSYLTDI